MKITWLGHAGFRIEIADQTLLIDPWMTGNPVFPEGAREAAIEGATQILLTHGHGDHATDVLEISKETGAPIIGIYDLMSHWEAAQGAFQCRRHEQGRHGDGRARSRSPW